MVVVVVVVVVVEVVMMPMPLVMAFVIFGFREKNGSGTDDWCMLLPLNPHAIFYTAPRKLTKATTPVFYCWYR